jgi:hypothetical protein
VLRVRGIDVIHLVDATHCVAHPYTAPARVENGRLSYPAAGNENRALF